MKQNTHAQYYPEAVVTCACGNKFVTGSTLPELKVDICSNCHPFYTGEQRFLDIQGRVELFEKRRAAATAAPKKAKAVRPQKPTEVFTLKDMLKGTTASK